MKGSLVYHSKGKGIVKLIYDELVASGAHSHTKFTQILVMDETGRIDKIYPRDIIRMVEFDETKFKSWTEAWFIYYQANDIYKCTSGINLDKLYTLCALKVKFMFTF